MIGEIAIGGVYVPTLLMLALAALVLAGFVSRFFSLIGAYRLVAYRPLVDLCLVLILLGLLVLLTAPLGMHP